VVLGAAARWRHVLRGTWDSFEIPLPFSQVVIVAACIPEQARTQEQVALAIESARQRAEELLSSPHPVAEKGAPARRAVEDCR
jgi:lysophospholipid acyltransferase (LPLAT)-like uncharacterized protein